MDRKDEMKAKHYYVGTSLLKKYITMVLGVGHREKKAESKSDMTVSANVNSNPNILSERGDENEECPRLITRPDPNTSVLDYNG
ncbi:hypothetical protein TNCV_1810031 [Trichonephila clavipes]|nr:hypothetical protein TNCV_1810031 [Trichonephila clavipes]